LFSTPLEIGQVPDPVEIQDSLYLFLHVKGWTTRVAASDQESRQRWADVVEELTVEQGAEHYRAFAEDVMRGKRIEFDRRAFVQLARLLAPLYFTPGKEAREVFLHESFGKSPDLPALKELGGRMEQLHAEPLFRVDGSVWTVRDFEHERERHPLVFRKKRFSMREFPEQFKLAIVDMVRDRYLTQVAYRRGYDTHPAVVRIVDMWRDAELALYQKRNHLRQNPGEGDALLTMTAYLDSLQQRYSDAIRINAGVLNAISLTRVSAFATQPGVPFPVVVPSFPVLTNAHSLHYGRLMD
jgi:hypothetical protein